MVNIHHGKGQLALLSPEPEETAKQQDLMTVKYISVGKESPKFDSLYESISQDISISLSTMIFQIAPEPVISLYDFLMTTFSRRNKDSNTDGGALIEDSYRDSTKEEANNEQPQKSRIRVGLHAIRGMPPPFPSVLQTPTFGQRSW